MRRTYQDGGFGLLLLIDDDFILFSRLDDHRGVLLEGAALNELALYSKVFPPFVVYVRVRRQVVS